MRTLVLLAALLVLALPGQAEPLKGAAEQVADALAPTALMAEDQAPVMDGQDQSEDGEQDMAVSFYGDERLTREADPSGSERRMFCFCRSKSCRRDEQRLGICGSPNMKFSLCCYQRTMY